MKWTEERKARHSALLRELWSQGRFANRKPATFKQPRCAICARPDGTRHFNLLIQLSDPSGTHGSRGAGAIDLCSRCWSEATRAAGLRTRVPTPRRKAA